PLKTVPATARTSEPLAWIAPPPSLPSDELPLKTEPAVLILPGLSVAPALPSFLLSMKLHPAMLMIAFGPRFRMAGLPLVIVRLVRLRMPSPLRTNMLLSPPPSMITGPTTEIFLVTYGRAPLVTLSLPLLVNLIV